MQSLKSAYNRILREKIIDVKDVVLRTLKSVSIPCHDFTEKGSERDCDSYNRPNILSEEWFEGDCGTGLLKEESVQVHTMRLSLSLHSGKRCEA
jgi:uncharacterized cysteine cluster protein YcgN (CxxCxxCC family)